LRVLRRCSLDPENAVWKSAVTQIFPTYIMEFLGAIRRSHPVNLHQYKPKLGQLHHPAGNTEGLRHKRPLRAGVYVFDYRILLLRIKIRRADNYPVNIRLAVAAFCYKRLRRPPSRLEQRGMIPALKQADQFPVSRAPKLVDRRHVHPRISVYEIFPVRRVLN